MHRAVQLGLVAAMLACFSVGPRAALAQISSPWPPQFLGPSLAGKQSGRRGWKYGGLEQLGRPVADRFPPASPGDHHACRSGRRHADPR